MLKSLITGGESLDFLAHNLYPLGPLDTSGQFPSILFSCFLTTRYQNYKSSLESHDPLTFLKQGLLSGGGPREKLQSEQRRLACLCETSQTLLYEFLNKTLISERNRLPGSNLEREGTIICSKYIK